MVLQVVLYLAVPAAALWACKRSRALALLSPVVLCYVVGIVIGNQPLMPLANAPSQGVAAASVLLAIGLLLMACDLRAWLRLARVTLLAVVLAVISVMVVSAVAALGFGMVLEESWKIAGMLVGVYTGGTANMMAIATALKVDPATQVMVHTSDVLVGGLYLIFLLLLAGRLFGRFLRPFTPAAAAGAAEAEEEVPAPVRPRGVLASLGLALLVVAGGGGLSLLVPGGAQEAVAILAVTTLAIALSFHPRVRALRETYATGDYLLLIFCVAVGSMASFEKLSETPPVIFIYTTSVVLASVAVHVLLCKLFKVDRDTCIITSTAALYGPAFIGPVAASLKNKEIVVSGITSGLVGLAAGNYLGLMVAYGVRWLMG